ncbi:hypothetical protein ABW636_07940 [Aquimarina sp. 2201CG1-2-11]|uniref:hypothetical protein n=1 Tax=Aquimarina discodermiae TaxID=3231043 RepID=UPI0034620969
MKAKLITIVFLILLGISFKTIEKENGSIKKIKIEWVKNLKGDFSFKEEWSYPECVFKNKFGQLTCDGICPPEIYQMKDKSGRIYKDSLQAFYKIVDTTHMSHSLKSENRMYEYVGTNFINFEKQKNGIIKGESLTGVSTHSKLMIEIENNYCSAWVDFNSIRDLGQNTFPLENETIKIDKLLFDKGIIKAVFDFSFKNTIASDEKLFWKGKIYSKIKN